MKKFILFLFVFSFIFSVNAQKQTFKYSETWGNAGFNLESQKSSGIEIIYSITEFSISDIEIEGENLQNIVLPGEFLFNDAGMPDLPGVSKLLAIPEGANAILKITDYRTEIIEGVEMAPAPVIPLETDPNLVYEKNEKVFSTNAFYPENPIKISELRELRGVDAVMLGITPFQYNPVTKQLIVYKDIKVEVSFEGGSGYFGENRLRNQWWEPILEDAFYNYASLPKIDFSKRDKSKETGEFEYIIIVPDDAVFIGYANQIKEFRRKQGISTGVFTTTEIGGNTTSAIETFIDNAYNTWTIAPVAVLLMADYGTSGNTITSPMYGDGVVGSNYCISDNIYADEDGDGLADITFARMTAQNETHLQTMVSKFIDYESNPPTSADFYNYPVTALGWQTERWFQICSETVGGYWKNELGKDPVRINAIYGGNPSSDPWSTATNTADVLNYFGPNGLGYIPATPGELGGWSGGNATMVNNAINSGCFMLQHRDHGYEQGWGEPDYSSSDINGLTNTDLTFVWSINCLTGKFNYGSEVFSEKFHRYTYNGNNSGALGIVAATEVSYSFVNDTYVWGCFDNMWPDFMPDEISHNEQRFIYPAFADIGGKYFLESSSWPYIPQYKPLTFHLFHHHGDAFLNVYSEVPQNLSVTASDVHIFGNSQYNVTVEDGSTIALTYFDNVNQETVIIATGLSTGGVTALDMTGCPPVGTDMLLTITKQNYFRYTQDVMVISPDGPYVIADGFLIVDGDNNQAEYGETFNLDITLTNVGTEISQNITVSLTTADVYVTSLTNNTNISYPNLDPDASATSSGNFVVELANNVPDQHNVLFDLAITDNSTKSTYNSTISFKVNAPVLIVGTLVVDDTAGNGDGILDPGETADIIIETSNTGHADISNVIGNISSASTDLILNTVTTSPVGLLIDESKNFIFNVTALGSAPEGTPADIDYIVTGGTAGQYSAAETLEVIIGFVPEYCDAGSNNTSDEYIQRVQFVDIDNTSGASSYTDFTNISTDVDLDGSYPITITNGEHFNDDQMGCWIDWNYDGDFDDTNEEVIITYSNPDGTGTVTVPSNARVGNTTMRLRVMYTGTLSPCGNASYGEVEDYTLNVVPGITQGGTLIVSNPMICIGSNTGDISLTNNSGTITDWEKQLNAGGWSSIGFTGSIYSETPIADGIWEYRVEVDNGAAYSNAVSIVVNPETVGGDVSGGSTICEGESTGTLTLSGHTGNVMRWQKQLDGGTWTDISNTGTTYSEIPSEDGTWTYCAVIKSGVCSELNSGTVDVIVNPQAVSGTAETSEDEICTGSTVLLTLTGYDGSIQWQDSPDGSSWTDIPGADSDSYTTDALTSDIFFRANVSLGSCPDSPSNSLSISVTENPDADYTYEANNQELTFTNTSSNATSYSWDFGDTNTSTEENPIHTYTESGTFNVALTAINGICSDDVFSQDIDVIFVGIEGLESGSMTIYPNPTKGIFNIRSFGFSDYKLEISDVNGKLILKREIFEESCQIDLSSFPKGVYFITVNLENEIKTGKIILK